MKWSVIYFHVTSDEELKLEEKLLKETVKKNVNWTKLPQKLIDGIIIPSSFRTDYQGIEYLIRESGKEECKVYEITGQKQDVKTYYNKDYFNSQKSNTNSKDMIVMDLYDIVTTNKLRPIKEAHLCGAQGFGEIGDSCPGCEGKYRERSVVIK
ncbi:MAG: hypothetical protein GON13_03450 [Nanoarchaeota archaeon]|nr:hypothetical protein [Nanoarchaeota archaeon]